MWWRYMHCLIYSIRVRVYVCIGNCKLIYIRRKISWISSMVDLYSRLGAVLEVRHHLRIGQICWTCQWCYWDCQLDNRILTDGPFQFHRGIILLIDDKLIDEHVDMLRKYQWVKATLSAQWWWTVVDIGGQPVWILDDLVEWYGRILCKKKAERVWTKLNLWKGLDRSECNERVVKLNLWPVDLLHLSNKDTNQNYKVWYVSM